MFKHILISVLIVSCAIYSNNSVISVDLSSDFTVTTTRGYTEFPGAETYGETGDPVLPVQSGILLLPSNADLNSVSLAIEGLEETTIAGSISIKPAAPLMECGTDKVLLPENKTLVDGKNVAIYNKNAFFPNKYVDVTVVGGLANYKIVRYMVYLAKYNPVTLSLKKIVKGKVVVNYESLKGYNKARNAAYKITPYARKMIGILASNASQFVDAYNAEFTYTEAPVYLIMTTSEVRNGLSNFGALVESKKNKGFDVKVITDSDWGGGTGDRAADNMREWLKDNYNEMGISHVLLVGSPHPSNSKLAMKVVSSTSLKPKTDFYFGELSGSESNFMSNSSNDYTAEVSTGRISVFSSSDYSAVDKCITRMITYENAPEASIGWRKQVLFAAKGWDSRSKCSDLFNEIKEKFADPNDWDVYRIYSTNEGNPDESSCSQSRVTNAWNSKKPSFVPWATHGSSTSSSGIMTSSGTRDLEHDDYPSIAFMGACTNADPTKSGNLSFAYFKNHGIAGVANTVSSYYRPGQTSWEGSGYQAGAIYGYCKGILNEKLGAGEALDYFRAQCKNKKDCWNNICSHNLNGCPDIGLESSGSGTPIEQFNKTVSTRNPLKINYKANVIYLNNLTSGATITIVNSAGVTIGTFNTTDQRVKLPLNALSSGFYFCVIKMKESVSKYKFIKL